MTPVRPAGRGLTAHTVVATTVVVLLTGAWLAVLVDSIHDERSAQVLSHRSDRLLASSYQLEKLVLDLETGARGYVITRQERFLEPWRSARAALPGAIGRFERMSAGEPVQAQRARALAGALDDYVRTWSEPLVASVRANGDEAKTLVETAAGKRKVDAIRRRFDTFDAAEQDLRALRDTHADDTAATALALGFGGFAGVVILLLLYAAYMVRAVIRPVQRVVTAASDIGSGALDTRLVVTGGGEVAELEVAINEMARGLERERAEREAAELRQRALEERIREQEKLESLGILAGGIAHDFNNLLLAVLGNAQLLLDELPASDPRQAHAGEIVLAGERAAELTRQMLAYSGRGHFVLGHVDLSTLVAGMSELLESGLPDGVALDFALDPCPGTTADATQLRQVVASLVANGVESVAAAGGRVTVSTGALSAERALLQGARLGADLPAGDYACLEVADDGPGIDGATLERIFDPFFTTKFAGRGLGLAAVLGIVRSHSGAILVESAPERARGVSVRVLVPTA
jgi:signal transduction histidine kinase